MDQRLRERVAVITASLAKGLSVYAPPRHVQTEAEQMQMLGHIAETINRYIEPNVNDGVIRERLAKAFSMLAATYDRRDWPTAAVMVQVVREARPKSEMPSAPPAPRVDANRTKEHHDRVMRKLEAWRSDRLANCICAKCEAARQEMEAAE